ncbi:MAG: type VI secretion system ATPase TssH [Rhodospirillaceae bacterium]
MMEINARTLITRLDPLCKTALEKAAENCVAMKHSSVQIEHLLEALLSEDLFPNFISWLESEQVSIDAIESEIKAVLEQVPPTENDMPAFSQYLADWLSAAWSCASGIAGRQQVDVYALIFAALDEAKIRQRLINTVPTLFLVPQTILKQKLLKEEFKDSPAGSNATSGLSATNDDLSAYTFDLTEAAETGRLDPIAGRETEIRQVIDILMRRRQNNPILTGEAGVGKTAIVEGLAQKIFKRDVPPVLQGVRVKVLDLAALQAGAGVKGAFEERLKSVIKAVTLSPVPIILFIDEAHQLIGAGGAEGLNDAANILKPALARGELRTIAATTWGEYKRYFEKDAALVRRFQLVKVDEPSEGKTIKMLRGMVKSLESHHGVEILDEAVIASVKLSSRHISGRQLPDKAVSILDTACARVGLLQSSEPPELEYLRSELVAFEALREQIQREETMQDSSDRDLSAREIEEKITSLESKISKAETLFREEQEAVFAIVKTRRSIARQLTGEDADIEEGVELLQERLIRLNSGLEAITAGESDIPIVVTANVVAQVIEDWTGIPAGKMIADEIRSVLQMESILGGKVVGQQPAVTKISRKIQTYRANLDNPGKPVGVFLLAGRSGIGKTETAHAIAEILFSDAERVITINLSEFQEAHSVALLKGAPPGYVGYGKGGILTEAVRRSPYSVVLLDEIEKAHPDILELFYQVFDKGTMEDGEGIKVSFKNTVIFLTSNIGEEIIHDDIHLATPADYDSFTQKIQPVFEKQFGTAFMARVTLLPYLPLGQDVLKQICQIKLDLLKDRVSDMHQVELEWSPVLLDKMAEGCRQSAAGARRIDQLINDLILPDLARLILERKSKDQDISNFFVSFSEGDLEDGILVSELDRREA